MPRTIDSPALILPDDAPHPESYRPDLPLRSELLGRHSSSELDRAYDEGYASGKRRARQDARAIADTRIALLESQLADEQAKTRDLAAQLAQQGARTS